MQPKFCHCVIALCRIEEVSKEKLFDPRTEALGKVDMSIGAERATDGRRSVEESMNLHATW